MIEQARLAASSVAFPAFDHSRGPLNAYNTLLARWQRAIDLDYYKTHVMGFPDDMIFGGLFPGMPAAEFTELAAEKERLFSAQLGARLTPTAGTEALLDRIARAGLRSAVVTNAPRENARMMLSGHASRRS